MPAAYHQFSGFEVSLLKAAVEKRLGFAPQSKSDCDKLADQIEAATKKLISVNTLRRFFSLMPTNSHPSLETLNVLSNFCGYNDFYEFHQAAVLQQKPAPTNLAIEAIDELYETLGNSEKFFNTFIWLTRLAFYEGNVSFLKNIFNAQAIQCDVDYPHGDYKRFIASLANEMRAHPQLFDVLIPYYAKMPRAQSHYFEWFVDYDYLTLNHNKAIAAYNRERHDNEAQLFSLCLLFLHHFLLLEKEPCRALIKKINAIELKAETHPFPAGRKFACNILFESMMCRGISKELKSKIEAHEKTLSKAGILERDLPSFHLMIAEAFSMANQHEDVLHYTALAQKNYYREVNDYSKGVLYPLHIYHAQALAHQGKKDEASAILQNTNPLLLEDYIRQYYLMQYQKAISKVSPAGSPEFIKSSFESKKIAKQHRFLFFDRDF